MIAAVLILGGLAVFLIVAVALVRRCERRLSVGPRERFAAAASAPAAEPISAYLDRMTAELVLPAADVAEVRAELADHLADSIATLEAEGLDREAAVREALGRLGPPTELGRQIRAAHQSTRRLLAGAGGGVFAGSAGFVLGYFGGFVLAFLGWIVFFAIGTVLALAGVHLPDLFAGDHGNTTNSLLIAVSIAVAAGAGTRYAVRTSAGISRRAPRSVAVFWVVPAALVFGWLALFGMRGPQSWLSVVAEACIPLMVAAAAFYRIDRSMPHVGRWAVIVTAITVATIALPLFAMSSATITVVSGGEIGPLSTGNPEDQLHLDTVAPMAPAAWLPEGNPLGGGGYSWDQGTGTHFGVQVVPDQSSVAVGQALSKWSDLRFEAWHALAGDQPGQDGIDTRYSSPFTIQPAVLSGNSLTASFQFERLRDAQSWWVVLTGVGPDGHRYRLEWGGGGQSTFNGSAWDWLTAPQ